MRSAEQAHPDRFAYRVEMPGASPITVAEQDLTEDLRALVELVLARRDDA